MQLHEIESNVLSLSNDKHPGMYCKLRHVFCYQEQGGSTYAWETLHHDMPGNIIVQTLSGRTITVETSETVMTRNICAPSSWHFIRLLRDLCGINAPFSGIYYYNEPVAPPDETEYDLEAVEVTEDNIDDLYEAHMDHLQELWCGEPVRFDDHHDTAVIPYSGSVHAPVERTAKTPAFLSLGDRTTTAIAVGGIFLLTAGLRLISLLHLE